MLDIRFIRENPELVRENIRKKFQDKKLPLVDEVLELDEKLRAAKTEANELRANRNALSKKIGMLMGQAKKDPSKLEEAEDVKAEVAREAARLAELEKLEPEYEEELTKRMMVIRTTAATSRCSASARRLCPISRSPTTRRSWRASTASIWTRRAASPATASTICAAISPACTPRCSRTRATL